MNIIPPEASTDERASPSTPNLSLSPPPAPDTSPHRRFATAAEEEAYRVGLADALRAPAPPDPPADAPPPAPGFDPVPLRYRADGLTPERQRDYVEALADTGLARVAAAKVGVSEQAIGRVRRRADARSFDLACEAARRIGARRLHAIAWERAIEGTLKRYYYHGELKGEERVYDNKLLIYLLGKTEHLVEPPPEAEAVAEHWEPWMEAIEQGAPPPPLDQAPEDAGLGPEVEEDEEEIELDIYFSGEEVWEDEDGNFWTRFPPPADYDGWEEEAWGMENYQRILSPRELEAYEARRDAERAERIAEDAVRRDRFFGFEGGDGYAADDEDEDEDEEEERSRSGRRGRQRERRVSFGKFPLQGSRN